MPDPLKDYPNLQAIVQGCIANKFSEWPAVRGELIKFMAASENKFRILGDWRDQRNAMEVACKEFPEYKETLDCVSHRYKPTNIWDFVKLVLQNYTPFGYQERCMSCSQRFNYRLMYRCWDCKSWICESCTLRHMGPKHISHTENQT